MHSKLKRYRRYLKLVIKTKTVLLFLLSIIISYLIVTLQNKKYDNLYLNNEELEIIATVISDKMEKEYKVVYKIRIDSIENKKQDKKYKGTYLLLNIKKKDRMQDLKYGMQIKIYGKYLSPSVARNTNGFNYKNYLKSSKTYGNINSEKIEIIKEKNINIIFSFCNLTKNKIKDNINNLFPANDGKLLLGILTGDTEEINEEIVDYFKTSNIYHMLAVSGAHVSYIILGIGILLNRIHLNKKMIYIITIISLIFFIGVIGYSPSVARAVIMSIMLLIANIKNRKLDIINSISLSMLIILLINPFTVYNIGFWLSYGGTIGIISFYNILIDKLKKRDKENQNKKNNQIVIYEVKKFKSILLKIKTSIIQMACVSMSAQVVIFPIMILNFNTISLTFLIPSLLAGYLMGIVTIGGFLLCIISFVSKTFASIIVIPLKIVLNLLIIISRFCSRLPLSKIYVIKPNLILIIIYYIFLLLICVKNALNKKKHLSFIQRKILNYFFYIKNKTKKDKTKLLSIILIISIIFSLYQIIPQNLKIYFIDVGQGDSCLIITPLNKKILIDSGGSALNDDFDVGKETLVPYLLARGIKTIDYIMISHFDADHCNGFIAVLENLNVKKVVIGEQYKISNEYTNIMKIIKKKKIPVMVVKNGDRLYLDPYTYLDILYPKEKLEFNNLNENSIVTKLHYYNFSMLFTGDLGIEGESKLLRQHNEEELKSDVLKLGHHGSKGSSSGEFLNAVKPKIVLIGVGENNTFGHPNDEVLERLEKLRSSNIPYRSNGRDFNNSK